MNKEIIMIAKSWKLGGNCIAGIDTTTGKWVRIVSDDASIQHAVTDEAMEYRDGTSPQILDIVSIACTDYTPNDYQPENYTMDSSRVWKKIGRADIDDVIALHPAEIHGMLFYNNEKKVTADEIRAIRPIAKYSLALIRPSDIEICVKRWNSARPQITASFRYMGRKYWFITVTDPEFVKPYQAMADGDYSVEDVYFVVSLADPSPKDGHHWKLIATILEE